ncbi:SpoIIE family protein phosphatase [Streptomyces sp. NPDC051907]|uniref:SpoIIE family protein phosphatase n=1 Tax=Streptomyces sp. NPDC051907 TaxID=3155284 RepID=UPI00343A09DA
MPRETVHRSTPLYAFRGDKRSVARTSLPGNPLAPSAARRFVRAALADWTNLGLLATCAFCRGAGGCPPGSHSTDRLADDAVLIVNELVTNAVVHAGTTVELLCRLEESTDGDPATLMIEVSDHHPTRAVRNEPHAGYPEPPGAPHSARDGARAGAREGERAGAPGGASRAGEPAGGPEYGRGLHLVAALADCWGITYRPALKSVWARLPVDGWDSCRRPGVEPALRRGLRAAEILAPSPRRAVRDDRSDQGIGSRGALSFLAEASDLLAGQLDEDLVAALAGQLLVPRLADWCAIWLDGEAGRVGWSPAAGAVGSAPRLARVWHADESRIERLREVLEKEPPLLPEDPRNGPVSLPWPREGEPGVGEGTAVAYRLIAGGRALGTLLVARHGLARAPDEVTALIEDFARRVALAISAARQYARQATISRVLQRGLLPGKVGQIPGVDRFLIYEPSDDGVAGGDFYDIFPAGPGGRWCFMLGDVQGSGPEAAVVTGLARPWLRLLAREGYPVGQVLDRLNRLLLDDAMEAAESAALMVAAAGGQDVTEGSQPRFLSLLYGELAPSPRGDGGVRCTLASAGHPLPLLLRPDGSVRPAAEPQVLLGVVDDVSYQSQIFDLAPGDTLLCVTDGVTERRSGPRMLDDGDGLAQVLAGCAGLTAQGVAERIRQTVYDFAERPPQDDLALLVLQAR